MMLNRPANLFCQLRSYDTRAGLCTLVEAAKQPDLPRISQSVHSPKQQLCVRTRLVADADLEKDDVDRVESGAQERETVAEDRVRRPVVTDDMGAHRIRLGHEDDSSESVSMSAAVVNESR